MINYCLLRLLLELQLLRGLRHDRDEAARRAQKNPPGAYPNEHLEMRQGARIILKSKVEPPPNFNLAQ